VRDHARISSAAHDRAAKDVLLVADGDVGQLEAGGSDNPALEVLQGFGHFSLHDPTRGLIRMELLGQVWQDLTPSLGQTRADLLMLLLHYPIIWVKKKLVFVTIER